MITLYHGSNVKVSVPDLSRSKPNKDFGKGFYLSASELKVKVFDDYSEEWALFVLMNRTSKTLQPCHSYDIVYGPIADDGVAYQLRRYQGGVISIGRLIDELKYAKGVTFQYFFGTERAINKLIAL